MYASDHYTNGHYNFSGYSCLGALTGNVGRGGAFVGSSPMGAPILNSAGALNVESVGSPKSVMLTKFPEVVLEGTYNGAPYTIRSLLISYMNLVNADTDRNLNIQVYKKLDFIVAIDFMMTESCEWADIVLPAAHWFEVEDVLCHSNHHPYAVYQDPCLEPAFESKPDFEIIGLLAKALGFESDFNFTQSEYLKLCFDTDKAKALGISYDTLKEKKIIRWVPEGTYISFEGQNFLTPSKRAEFYLENPKPTNAYPAGQVRAKELLPYWEPPLEAWPEEGAKYPLHCVFFRMKYMGHTQWSDIEVLRELDIEPYVKINPADAKPRGIANGDKVRIFNDRGYVVMKANLVENFPPGIIGVPKGFQKKQFIDGHASELTHKTMNGFMANNCFFDVAVEIEKM